MTTNILMTIVISLLIIQFIKSITIGSNFSFYNYFKYKDDYKKWYTIRQKYIPPHKRENFTKKRK